MYLHTLVILLSIGNTFCDFLSVPDGCKYWKYLKVYGNGDSTKVHCIIDQDFQSGLVYTEWKMIPKGKCPIYNRFASQIDTIPCNRNIGICPNNSFPSYSGVTFTGCYDAIRKKSNVMKPTTIENVHIPAAESDKSNYPVGLLVIATLSMSINCMVIIVCVWHFICRSKIKWCRDEYGMPRRKVCKTPDHIASELDVVPRIGVSGDRGMTKMRGEENGVLDASKLENVYRMNPGQRRVLNTMRDNKYLVTNESTLDEYGMPRRKVSKNPDHSSTKLDVMPGIGANGDCGMTRMRGEENGVADASKLENVNQWNPGQRRVLNTMRGNKYPGTNESTLENIERLIGTNSECRTTMRGNENLVPITSTSENVIPREQGQRRVLNTMSGNDYLVTNASTLENVIPREQGQRRVLNTMSGNEYLVTNASTLGNIRRATRAKSECGMTMRGNENLVTNASTSAKIPREQDQWQVLNTMGGNRYPVTNGSTLVDVKVQEDYCSTPTSETYSQISSADSKTSEDDLVIKERGRVHRKHYLNDMQLHCNLSHIH